MNGKWTLDQETTVAKLAAAGKPVAASPGEGFLQEVVAGLQKGVSRLLLTQYEGLEIEFTGEEMRRIRGGVGEVLTYRIIERPAAGIAVLQYADGEIVTWARSESGIRMRLPVEEEKWIYFRAVK